MNAKVVIACAALVVGAACTPQTVKTSGDSAAPNAGSTPAKKTATIGTPITLKGQRPGEQVQVTVVKVVNPAPAANEFSAADSGKQIVGVQVKIVNTGSISYSDAPDNDAKLKDAAGQQYDVAIGKDTGAGAMLGSDVKLAPGDSALGFVDFEVPTGTTLQTFQFTPDSSFAPDTGQWSLAG